MKNICHRLLVITLFVIAGIHAAMAQFTETREFKKAFKVNPQTNIEIINKYGKIEVTTWEKDSVVVEVHMLVEEKKLSKLEKSLDNIDFDFNNTPNYLIIQTDADKNRTQLENELLRFKETLLQADGSIEINYKVWLPATNHLKIENKFGDIYLDDYKGEAEIDLSNGKLKAHNFGKKVTLTLNFAGASINSLPVGKINSNYSDIFIGQSGQLTISSKSSEIEIIENQSLKTDSRRDKFRIKRTEILDAGANFSNFRISTLTERASLRLNYGDVEIEKVEADFSNLYIDCRSTDLSLYFAPESQFNFDITETKADLDLGQAFTVSDKKEISLKDQTNNLHGFFRKKSDGKEKLQINITSGGARLRSY